MTCTRIITAITVLLLAGCGGGGGGDSGLNPAGVMELTGAQSPVETSAAQLSRAAGIISRADSMIMSTMSGETNHPALPTFQITANCSVAQCRLREPTLGYAETIYLSDLEFRGEYSSTALGTKNGVTFLSASGSEDGLSFDALGAWMRHAGFVAQTESGTLEDITFHARYALAGGDLTNTAPTGSATWLGVMVGLDLAGGGKLAGDAALNFDLGMGWLDAAFSSIKNLDSKSAHHTPTIMFTDVPVGSNGTFQAGLVGNKIQGAFYGPEHVEAAGVFEQSRTVGAFGAVKQ